MFRIGRNLAMVYGSACYSILFVTFLYGIGWVTNLVVPRSLDAGAAGNPFVALAIDVTLTAAVAFQQRMLARPGVKRALMRVVPHSVARATSALASSVAFLVLFAFWQPIPLAFWQLEGAAAVALHAGSLLGFSIVLYATLLVDYFDLLGLREVFRAWRGGSYTENRFVTPELYRFIRQLLYVGWMIALWSAPTLTVGHALVAGAMTAYIWISIPDEQAPSDAPVTHLRRSPSQAVEVS